MPLYQLDIEKAFGSEFWTNRYILNAASLSAAVASIGGVINAERNITDQNVSFTRCRVADLDPNTDQYTIVPLNQVGARANLTNLLPLFNVLRVDFGVAEGRPSRKYLRGVLVEGDIDFTTISTSALTFFDTNYVDLLVPFDSYVDVDGEPIISGSVYPQVAMRQLRRGSRRRTEPIIPSS
jgi:hypothetical protein